MKMVLRNLMTDPRKLKGIDRIKLAIDRALELQPDEPLFIMAKADIGILQQSLESKDFAIVAVHDMIASVYKNASH